MSYCMVITTVSGRDDAEKLAKAIVEQQLAACVQLNDIDSYYIWDKKLTVDTEVRLMIKTVDKNYKKLEKYILVNHPYEIPEIIKLPFADGYSKYLDWIDEVTE